jgi:hypothetical protein
MAGKPKMWLKRLFWLDTQIAQAGVAHYKNSNPIGSFAARPGLQRYLDDFLQEQWRIHRILFRIPRKPMKLPLIT